MVLNFTIQTIYKVFELHTMDANLSCEDIR